MHCKVVLASALLMAAGVVFVEGGQQVAKKDDVEKQFSKFAQLGPGVYAIKTDAKGRIQSCVIVGDARISTVLGKTKGIQTARSKARLAASAEYVKWLKEKVSVRQKSEEETVLFMEGSEENDQQTLRESGKAIEKDSKTMESISEGLVRGLQVLHVEIDGDNKTCTVVVGWSAATAKAIEDYLTPEKGGKIRPTEGSSTIPQPGAGASKNKTIESKKTTSDDAKKFLPD